VIGKKKIIVRPKVFTAAIPDVISVDEYPHYRLEVPDNEDRTGLRNVGLPP
jgi:hypothetical protein